MMSKPKITRFLVVSSAVLCLVFVSGIFSEANAQRDPFAKNPKLIQRKVTRNTGNKTVKKKPVKPKGPVVVSAPPVEQRIAYFMSMREQAALNGQPLPKVTSVLTLDEMSVIGIFKTPRGFAAMIEAVPIKLSYTIYPGEKFFDGQLVAVEENRLVFRKVTKMSNNKFISTVENKVLRQADFAQEIQVASSSGSSGSTETAKNAEQPQAKPAGKKVNTTSPGVVISPLDEMQKQKGDEAEKESAKKKTKVAKQP